MRHAKRVDDNHQTIKTAFVYLGYDVEDLSHIGHGVPDLFVAKPTKDLAYFVEVKNDQQAPSKRRLTKDEQFWHAILKRAGVTVQVIETVDQVKALDQGAAQ